MLIEYNSKKENMSACIFGVLFFGAITLYAYFECNYYMFVLGLLMVLASLIAIGIYRFKKCFNHINVKIDTDNQVIHVRISSGKAKDKIIQNISFNEIQNVKLKLTTWRGNDYIEFLNKNDFSFSIPIHHNQIKELEKFFNIQHSTLYGNEENNEKIKKLYSVGLLGSMNSIKGSLFILFILIVFLTLNFPILIILEQMLYNAGVNNTIISMAFVVEISIFGHIILLLWKRFR